MIVKIKKLHENAVIPQYAKEGDAGLDLTAVDYYYDDDGNAVYRTGLAIEIPEGYVGLVYPRSSISKKDLYLTNSVGVIDSGYRGEITLKFKPVLNFEGNEDSEFLGEGKYDWIADVYIPFDKRVPIEPIVYDCNERIAQLIIMPYPKVEFEEVEELTQTERGDGGFGSSGK